MSLHACEIAAVVASLAPDLRGGLVQQVTALADEPGVALAVRHRGRTTFAILSAAPGYNRLGASHTRPPKGPSTHPVVAAARKMVAGTRIASLTQVNGDRVVEFRFEGAAGTCYLVAELTDRHGNLFLLDADRIIVASMLPNRSQRRRLTPSHPYEPPAVTQPPAAPNRFTDEEAVAFAVECHYRALRRGAEQERARRRRLAALHAAQRRLRRLLTNLENDRRQAAAWDQWQRRADLLKAHLYAISPGAHSVTVTDEAGGETHLAWSHATPQQAMAAWYDKAKRLRRACDLLDDRIAQVSQQLRAAAERRAAMERGDEDETGDCAPQTAGSPQRAAPSGTRRPWRTFAIAEGKVAKVGKSAADNDALTVREARPWDLWLHARGGPGSHVVVPLQKGQSFSQQVLLDAAHLAAHFSFARAEEVVEITYALRKYVQKRKGAPPGAVHLLREKTLLLRVDRARLARLLENAS